MSLTFGHASVETIGTQNLVKEGRKPVFGCVRVVSSLGLASPSKLLDGTDMLMQFASKGMNNQLQGFNKLLGPVMRGAFLKHIGEFPADFSKVPLKKEMENGEHAFGDTSLDPSQLVLIFQHLEHEGFTAPFNCCRACIHAFGHTQFGGV